MLRCHVRRVLDRSRLAQEAKSTEPVPRHSGNHLPSAASFDGLYTAAFCQKVWGEGG